MPALLRQAPVVFLDDARLQGAAHPLVLDARSEILCAQNPEEVPAALQRLDAAVAEGKTVAGFFAYELGAVFEPQATAGQDFSKRPVTPEMPLIWALVSDHPHRLHSADCEDLFLSASAGHQRRANLRLDLPDDIETWFADRFAAVQSHIEAGDVYQVNLTFDYAAQLEGDPLALYQQLRQSQPAPFAAYIDTGVQRILSLSPELFVRRRGGVISASPMKGTAPRGKNAAEDVAQAASLTSDAKTRAENLMIVDLLRNDLSRLAVAQGALQLDLLQSDVLQSGAPQLPVRVSVDKLFDVTAYPSLWQMTSDIRADLQDQELSPSQMLRSLFPCGSVTGAPKIRAMQVIEALEQRPRGVYCGAIGYFRGQGQHADWCLNVPIRTLQLNDQGYGRLSVGAGLVADSQMADELAESCLKARFATRLVDGQTPLRPKDLRPHLIETMAVTAAAQIPLLEDHLCRLRDAARRLGYDFCRDRAEQMIRKHLAGQAAGQPLRLRLLLGPDGDMTLQHQALTLFQDQIRLAIADQRLDASDPLRGIKSTARGVYAAAPSAARALGVDDMLFLNQSGELADTGIFNIWLHMDDGRWLTPSLASGALPGVMRARLLANLRCAEEAVLNLDSLAAAKAVWVSNAVRGLVPARLVHPS